MTLEEGRLRGVERLSVDSVGNANRLIETDQEKLILRTSTAISSHENLQSAVKEKDNV